MKRRLGLSVVQWVVAGVVLVALAAGVFLAFQFARPQVTITEVTRGPVVQAFYATGTLSAVREYSVKTPIDGTLDRLLVDKGDAVKAGQPVARVIEPALLYVARKAEAELQEKRARAAENTSPVLAEFDARISATKELLQLAQREQRRVTAALETRAATQADLDAAINRVKTLWSESEGLKSQRAAAVLKLKSDLEVAESAHQTARWNLEQQTVKSPIDGVVLDWPVSPGTRLAVNDMVMTVADVRPEKLVMRAAVDEEDMTDVRLGQTVEMVLYAFPDNNPDDEQKPFVGKVVKIYPKADPDRRTFEVDVEPAQPNKRFAAGMTGELAFVISQLADTNVAPAQSLQDGKLYTIRAGRLRAVDAKIGLKSIQRIEVQSGLNLGEVVVISPVGSLKEGQPVRVGSRIEPKVAAALNKEPEKEIFRGGF